ncbi:Integrase [Theobroma cacao]|nr:Integrase [Theobroma cacao]
MFFDGASNALGHGIGVVLVSLEGDHYPVIAKLNFYYTNNVAEYEACVMGLQAIIEGKIHILEVYEDSALETRDSKLVRYHKYVSKLIENFDKICFTHLPREENHMADALATLAAMFKVGTNVKIQPIMINLRECPAHCSSVEEEIDEKSWYHDIVHFLKFQQYPDQSSENDKKTIRRLAMNFFLDGNILYKRSKDQTLLRCVDSTEARRIVKKVHEGICGAHASEHKLARQVMRAGCQIYADRIHTPTNSLHVLTSPWPFSMWGMDVIGLITPKASNRHRFILVAIDYFTKWVKIASYANVTQKVVCKFIQKEIMCRYGLSERIITDNDSNLNSLMMKEVCAKFKIKHHNSTPYRPKMNGVVEAANKNIKRIIEKMTDVYKDWHEKLPFALHAYRTTVRTSTGATPFILVYEMEAVLPIEVFKEVQLEEAEWVNARYEQLNLIKEKRLTAL